MAGGYRLTFKARFRARAFGWRRSKIAIARLKEAISEIKAVNRTDRVAAGEGAVVLMERLWPAFQAIDSSSGALGTAVNAALKEIIPILIAAPAMPKVRASWLERLYQAVQKDGVQYLYPAEERWGEIAVFPELMNEYADLLLPVLRRVHPQQLTADSERGPENMMKLTVCRRTTQREASLPKDLFPSAQTCHDTPPRQTHIHALAGATGLCPV